MATRESTRERILDAAASAMVEVGPGRTTTKEVAARAGFAEGTIYLYFETKLHLLAAVVQERLFLPSMSLVPDESGDRDTRTVLTELVRTMLDHLDEMIPLLSSLLADPALAEIVRSGPQDRKGFVGIERLAEYLARQQERGAVRDGDTLMMARQLFGTPFHHRYLSRAFGEERLDPSGDEFVGRLVASVLVASAKRLGGAKRRKAGSV